MKNTIIIIVTYNAMPWIERCLQSCSNYPVVVVDNASADNTVSHIQNQYPNVVVLPQDKNLGFGQGNNLGISYALKNGAESVFLLNQDAYLAGDCLERLIEVQKQHPEFGIVSPVHLDGTGENLDYNFVNFANRSKTKFLENYILKNQRALEIIPIDFINAAGWLLSKACIEKTGGFNPYFFQYGEDRDYVNRAIYHGFKVGVVPDAFAAHDRIQTDSSAKNERMQKLLLEVKILDPNTTFAAATVLGKFKKGMLHSLRKFNFSGFIKNRELYRYFKNKTTALESYGHQIKSKATYLFLEK